MKKAFILLLVVLVVITGLPVPMAGMGSMNCADCLPGVLFMGAACLAVLTGAVTLLAAALVLTLRAGGVRGGGRNRDGPLLRPPRLA